MKSAGSARNDKQELARRGIRDFAENGRAAGASGGRKIRGALVERFVGEEGKRECFLDADRDA